MAAEIGYVPTFDNAGDLQNCISKSEFARAYVDYDFLKKHPISFSINVSGSKIESPEKFDAYMSDLKNAKKFIELAKKFCEKKKKGSEKK